MRFLRVIPLVILVPPMFVLMLAGLLLGLLGKAVARIAVFGIDTAIMASSLGLPSSTQSEIKRVRSGIRAG